MSLGPGLTLFTGAPVSLTTWSMPPSALRNRVNTSLSFTPALTGTRNAVSEWIAMPWLKKL